MTILKAMAVAISMYSRIPVPRVEWEEKNMKYAMGFFPAVGVFIGAAELLAGSLILEYTTAGALLFAAVMTLIPAAVTGGIHLDGFADTVDALSSHKDRENRLAIMEDPHTGAFAVIGLCCYFLAAFALLSEIPGKEDPRRILILTALIFPVSRALSGIAAVSFPPAKKRGLLRTFQEKAQKGTVRLILAVWLLLGAAGMIFADWRQGCMMLALAGAVYVYYYGLCRRQFGGTTGDLAGYFLQLCELAMLAGAVLTG